MTWTHRFTGGYDPDRPSGLTVSGPGVRQQSSSDSLADRLVQEATKAHDDTRDAEMVKVRAAGHLHSIKPHRDGMRAAVVAVLRELVNRPRHGGPHMYCRSEGELRGLIDEIEGLGS